MPKPSQHRRLTYYSNWPLHCTNLPLSNPIEWCVSLFFTTRRADLAGKVNIMNKIRKALGKKSADSYVEATLVKQDDALYSEAIEYSPVLPRSHSPDHQNQSYLRTSLKQDNIERQTPRLEGLTLRIVGTATTSVQVFSSKIMENCISKSS